MRTYRNHTTLLECMNTMNHRRAGNLLSTNAVRMAVSNCGFSLPRGF